MNTKIDALERKRLSALRDYRVVDTGSEPAFDAVTKLVASICHAPMAMISLITEDRQWFKSKVGTDVNEMPREVAFCAHAIQGTQLMEVPDAQSDSRFLANPLVTDEPRIRFYAGMPLVSSDGYVLGTLCVVDLKPRHLTAEQRDLLEQLSIIVMALLEARRTAVRNEHLGRLLEQSSDEVYIVDTAMLRVLDANSGALKNLQYTLSELRELHPADVVDRFDLERWLSAIAQAHQEGVKDLTFSVKLCRKDGTRYPAEGKMQLWRDGDRLLAMFVVHDVTHLKVIENHLRTLAEMDSLTGLMNRSRFYEQLRQAIDRKAHNTPTLGVLFLDVDNFKSINDELGHHAGDDALRETARRLQASVRKTDSVARFAGDEFVILLEGLEDSADATRVAADILEIMKAPFLLGTVERVVSISIGIAIRHSTQEEAESLLQRADQALYSAKSAGRGRYCLSESESSH